MKHLPTILAGIQIVAVFVAVGVWVGSQNDLKEIIERADNQVMLQGERNNDNYQLLLKIAQKQQQQLDEMSSFLTFKYPGYKPKGSPATFFPLELNPEYRD